MASNFPQIASVNVSFPEVHIFTNILVRDLNWTCMSKLKMSFLKANTKKGKDEDTESKRHFVNRLYCFLSFLDFDRNLVPPMKSKTTNKHI